MVRSTRSRPKDWPPLQTKRQMVAAIAKRPQGSVWRQIRETPKVGQLEMLWIRRRSKPGVLIPAGYERRPYSVTKGHRLKARSDTHTHILQYPGDTSLPSVFDLLQNINDTRLTKGIRKWHVATVTPSSGIPQGIITIQAGKGFVQNAASRREIIKIRKEYALLDRKQRHVSHLEFREITHRLRLRLLKLGLRLRIRARPGFVYHNFRFVRK